MISEKSIKLMMEFEGIDQPSVWPGGQSGISLGIGYDLGYASVENFEADWKPYLTQEEIDQLKTVLGLRGSKAKQEAPRFRNIVVKYADAKRVFINRSLPLYFDMAKNAFPGLEELPEDAQGALVSLVYNRGAAMHDNSPEDRRKEMRVIRDAVPAKDLREIADQL